MKGISPFQRTTCSAAGVYIMLGRRRPLAEMPVIACNADHVVVHANHSATSLLNSRVLKGQAIGAVIRAAEADTTDHGTETEDVVVVMKFPRETRDSHRLYPGYTHMQVDYTDADALVIGGGGAITYLRRCLARIRAACRAPSPVNVVGAPATRRSPSGGSLSTGSRSAGSRSRSTASSGDGAPPHERHAAQPADDNDTGRALTVRTSDVYEEGYAMLRRGETFGVLFCMPHRPLVQQLRRLGYRGAIIVVADGHGDEDCFRDGANGCLYKDKPHFMARLGDIIRDLVIR
jgi:hypothetical protein